MESLMNRPVLLMSLAAAVLFCSVACSDSASTQEDKDNASDGDEDDSTQDDDSEDDDSEDDNQGVSKADAGRGTSLDAGKDSGSTKLDASVPNTRSDGGSAISAGPDAGKPTTGGQDNGIKPASQTLPPVTDYEKAGPFDPTVLNNQGPGNAYTIFRPKTLGENDFKHSPIIFGCGIATTPSWYTRFLSNIASHGFVVIASNSSGVTDADMMMGLEWILEQNESAGDYQGKLDVDRAVSMGYSIGGTAAVNVGAHPSVMTTVSIHGHNTMSALHGPLLQTTGTNDDIGLPLQQSTYDNSMVQTFLGTLQNASHFEILGGEDLQDIVSAAFGDGDGGRELGPITAWLRYWVYGDEGAKHFFFGEDCVLCKDPWANPQRKNWPDE